MQSKGYSKKGVLRYIQIAIVLIGLMGIAGSGFAATALSASKKADFIKKLNAAIERSISPISQIGGVTRDLLRFVTEGFVIEGVKCHGCGYTRYSAGYYSEISDADFIAVLKDALRAVTMRAAGLSKLLRLSQLSVSGRELTSAEMSRVQAAANMSLFLKKQLHSILGGLDEGLGGQRADSTQSGLSGTATMASISSMSSSATTSSVASATASSSASSTS